MLDGFNRCIDYLRISVTDRCDLRCLYCMPAEGVCLADHADILSYEQIEAIAREAVALGIRRIRLTGGEPLLRRNIESLVARLSCIKQLGELTMTTNGTRLAAMAENLKKSGLDRVNISIDSLNPDTYSRITRGGDLRKVLDGVQAAIDASLTPIKINMVVLEDTTADELAEMRAFCDDNQLQLQKIMQFSLYDRRDLSTRFHTERPPKCRDCNRLRLTSDGFLKPCLFSEDEIRIDFDDIRASILRAVEAKPENGVSCRSRSMHAIGG